MNFTEKLQNVFLQGILKESANMEMLTDMNFFFSIDESPKDNPTTDTSVPTTDTRSEENSRIQESEPLVVLDPEVPRSGQTTGQPDPEENVFHKQNLQNEKKSICRMSQYFPTEFSNYNPDKKKEMTASSSQVELVALNDQSSTKSSVREVSEDMPLTLSWPAPIFVKPSLGAGLDSGEASGSQSHRYKTSSLHTLASAKGENRTQASTLLRTAKQQHQPLDKEEANASSEYDQAMEVEEHTALLNMALSSCLVDNAQLRTTVVSEVITLFPPDRLNGKSKGIFFQ